MIDRWCGAVRWLWNTSLGIRCEAYRQCALSLTGNDISRWLTQWKRTPGHTWLADVPATCLTQCLRDQDRAFGHFFARRARYPKFKRRRSGGSLRFQGIGAGWSRGILSLPKLGPLKLAEALPRIETPDMITLQRDALLYKGEAAGRVILEAPAWYPSSKTCSYCGHVLDELRLDERQWDCPKCGTSHDRDVNAACNILQRAMKEIAGCDDRDLRVDARHSCFDDCEFIEQVLAGDARNGHRGRACQEQASSR